MDLQKLIVVLGTNASGKSSLGINLAKKYNGEIISADSRQIYRGLDLGSGKVTPEETLGVPHYMIDILDPNIPYSVADFQMQSYKIIDDIIARGKVPFLVGGTGLYVRSIVNGYTFDNTPPNEALRLELEEKSVEELYRLLAEKCNGQVNLADPKNKRRLIRALEKTYGGKEELKEEKCSPRYRVLQLGVTWPKEILHSRIDERLDKRLGEGMIDEVRALRANGATDDFLYKLGLEYRYILWYLNGKYASLDEMKEELGRAIKRFAKRQMTWFRKDTSIIWLNMDGDYETEAQDKINEFLFEGEIDGNFR